MTTTTAGQRRARAQHEYNANLRECPGHEVLATLSDKWVTLVLSALADGPLRHSELRRTVAGATQKMLTQTLRKLEREGLVSRTVDSAVPPRVDYALPFVSIGSSGSRPDGVVEAEEAAHVEVALDLHGDVVERDPELHGPEPVGDDLAGQQPVLAGQRGRLVHDDRVPADPAGRNGQRGGEPGHPAGTASSFSNGCTPTCSGGRVRS
jgi:DNA-binding HxlR family transcriptional regulator